MNTIWKPPFAVEDDALADFDDFDDYDDEDEIDDEGMEGDEDFDYDEGEDYDEDEFEDAFTDGDGGMADSYFDCVSGPRPEPPSRKTAGLRNQSLSNS